MELLDKVLDALDTAGIPAVRAYPGEEMPHPAGAVAAVQLGGMDWADRTATVLVTVLSPGSLGGGPSEDTAVACGQALEGLGTVQIGGGCRFQPDFDCYCTELTLKLTEGQVRTEWTAGRFFTVKQGTVALPYAVRFTARQVSDPDTGVALKDSPWQVEVEEEIPAGAAEQDPDTGSFTLSLTRSNGVELFQQCRWTQIQRTDTAWGLRQIRQGQAASRLKSMIS